MNAEAHWDKVFQTKASDALSWHRPHLEASLELIERHAIDRSSAIIDVGAGESTLVDDLICRGYHDLTILDISRTAVERTHTRLAEASRNVKSIVGDILQVSLPASAFDVWHDRAVFHFLVDLEQRRAYVRAVLHAVKPGGHVIVSTFAHEGPSKCSGLEVMRYDAESLHEEFGRRFQIEESSRELHHTPWGAAQQFVYCCCKVE